MKSFFSQRVNQWLGLALVGLLCVWTVIYYFGHKAYDFGDAYAANAYELKD